MAYYREDGTQFDPATYAYRLTRKILPEIETAASDVSITYLRPPESRTERSAIQAHYLLEATQRFAPPEDLPGAADLYATAISMAALRAQGIEMVA